MTSVPPGSTRVHRAEAAPRAGRSGPLQHVQGLRALAVASVVVYHAGIPGLPGGFVGVDIFFVISGFVISRMLLAELEATGRLRFGRFYLRRVARLLPAASLVLAFTAVASALLQSPFGSQQDTAATGVASSAWLANAGLYLLTGDYFDNASDTFPLLHMWSLSVEEQFYLVFPALILVLHRLGRRRGGVRVLGLGTWVLLVLSLGLCLFLSFAPAATSIVSKPDAFAFYASPTRAWEFAAGVLVALALRRGDPGPRVAGPVAAAGLLVVVVTLLTLGADVPFPGWVAVVPVAGTAAALWGARASTTMVGRALSWGPAVRLGDISYGVYLWHWPLIVFATGAGPDWWGTAPLAAALAVPVAVVSYRFVEQPLRERARTPGALRWRSLVSWAVVPPVLFAGLWAGAASSWGQADLRDMGAQVKPVPVGYDRGCHSLVPLGERDLRRCTYPSGGGTAGRSSWLVGDSNAGQYAEAVIAASRTTGSPVVLGTASGCPMVDVVIRQRGASDPACRRFVVDSLTWLEAHPPRQVLLSAASEGITDPDTELVDPQSGRVATTPSAKERTWQNGLERVVLRLQRAGSEVVLIRTVPHFGSVQAGWWSPARCETVRLVRDVSTCSVGTTLAGEDRRQRLALAAEARVLRDTGAASLDLRDVLCPRDTCVAERDGRWVYRDGLHISTRESSRLGPLFAEVLAARTPDGEVG